MLAADDSTSIDAMAKREPTWSMIQLQSEPIEASPFQPICPQFTRTKGDLIGEPLPVVRSTEVPPLKIRSK